MKKSYLDILMKHSRFEEFQFRREFTEFVTSQFVAEAATKCLEIKRKYSIAGKPLTPSKAVEVAFGEGLIIDVEPENNRDQKGCWIGRTDDLKSVILWIEPNVSVKDGQDFMMFALSTYLLNEYHDLFYNGEDFGNLESMLENPPRFKAVMVAETLTAMLKANESKSELISLQRVVKQGGQQTEAVK